MMARRPSYTTLDDAVAPPNAPQPDGAAAGEIRALFNTLSRNDADMIAWQHERKIA